MNARRLYVVNLLMGLLPPTRCWAAKRWLLRWAGASVGQGVHVVSSVRIYTSGTLTIGDHTFIGHEVLIVGGAAPIAIGARVDIGPRVLLVTGSHRIAADSDRAAGEGRSSPIVIGDGVWIGAGATVLGGVELGGLSVVAAAGLVKESAPSRVLLAGVPARIIRNLDRTGG